MLFRFGITILLGHTEVDDVNDVGGFRVGSAYQKVVGLDISVDQVLFVDCLYSGKLEHGQHGSPIDRG